MKKGWGGKVLLGLCFLAAHCLAASSISNVDELKTDKRFGVGFSAGGPLSVMGLEVDVNVTPELSISGGLGTGLDYSTFMVKARYFLPGKWVSPYLLAGIARWWTDGTSANNLAPSLINRFLTPGYNTSQGFNMWMIYPGVGVQFMHPMGIGFFAEVQYLFRLFSFANGVYGGVGMHWYF